MANHKRKRAKNQRAGCLLCKPQKANNQKAKVRYSRQEQLSQLSAHEQIEECPPREEREALERLEEYEANEANSWWTIQNNIMEELADELNNNQPLDPDDFIE